MIMSKFPSWFILPVQVTKASYSLGLKLSHVDLSFLETLDKVLYTFPARLSGLRDQESSDIALR